MKNNFQKSTQSSHSTKIIPVSTSHPSALSTTQCDHSTKVIPASTSHPPTLSTTRSWHTIHRQFSEYGRNAKEWLRKCQLLLPQIEKQKIWHKKRFKSIYEYAAKLAGMNHDQVNEYLRVLHKAEIFPSLMRVIEQKGINSVKPVLGIINQENVGLLTEKAMTMNKNTLEVFVRYVRQNNLRITGLPRKPARSVNLQGLAPEPSSAPASLESQHSSFNQRSTTESPVSQKVTIAMQLDPETADQLQKIKGQGDWNATISELLKLRREKLEQEKPKTVEAASRPIPAAIEKYVLAKTNSTCAFPGCQKSYAILHHTDRFAMYRIHDPDKIFPLCVAHERLAHLGLIENENQPPQYWKLRAQPDYDDPKYEIDGVVAKYRQLA